MYQKADLVVKEVQPPQNHWCKSGHKAPATFHRDGLAGINQLIKFFQIASEKMPGVNGIYCEPCLIVANAMKREEVKLKPI